MYKSVKDIDLITFEIAIWMIRAKIILFFGQSEKSIKQDGRHYQRIINWYINSGLFVKSIEHEN